MPILIKLGTKYPSVKGIQNSSNKGSGLLERGDICKNRVGHLKIFFSSP
jgi:hypothetical protein